MDIVDYWLYQINQHLLNAHVIAEWVEKSIVWKVLVLVLAIVYGQSINIGIANTFHKYC